MPNTNVVRFLPDIRVPGQVRERGQVGWAASRGAAQERAQDGRELGGPLGRTHEHDEAGTPFNGTEIVSAFFGTFSG